MTFGDIVQFFVELFVTPSLPEGKSLPAYAKTLKFAPKLVSLVLSGEKTSTWRLFDDKNLQVGDRVTFINKETGEEFAKAMITSVREKRLGNITSEGEIREGHDEHFRTDRERLETYRKYYGNRVTEDTVVKMLKYELVDQCAFGNT